MAVHLINKENLLSEVLKTLKKANSVLDIGCGIMPQTLLKAPLHICCEPHKEYVEKLQAKLTDTHETKYLIINSTWDHIVELLPPQSVDTIFLLDIIEHIEKTSALELLLKSEAIARRQIVIFTPLGYMPQSHPDGIDAWGLHGAAWQEHKSGWMPEDFNGNWELFVAEKYHFIDNKGKAFENPFGAIWAINNIDKRRSIAPVKESRRERIHCFVDSVIDICYKIRGMKVFAPKQQKI